YNVLHQAAISQQVEPIAANCARKEIRRPTQVDVSKVKSPSGVAVSERSLNDTMRNSSWMAHQEQANDPVRAVVPMAEVLRHLIGMSDPIEEKGLVDERKSVVQRDPEPEIPINSHGEGFVEPAGLLKALPSDKDRGEWHEIVE